MMIGATSVWCWAGRIKRCTPGSAGRDSPPHGRMCPSVVPEVEPYASRGARTVPGGEPPARGAPTRPGDTGQSVTIRGQNIDPGKNGRVIVESEHFRNGRPVSAGR